MSHKIPLAEIPRTASGYYGVQRLPEGWKNESRQTHQHDYDEFAVIWKGRCIMRDDGVDTEYVAGDVVRFPARQMHCAIAALEDTEYFWCRAD